MDKNEKKGTSNETVKKLATVADTCDQCGGQGRCPCMDPWS